MNDKELADRIVALGVGFSRITYGKADHRYGPDDSTPWAFVRDWRVAGALMEKMSTVDELHAPLMRVIDKAGADAYLRGKGPLPRAIIEACSERLFFSSSGDRGHELYYF